jgi:hypothetical protein
MSVASCRSIFLLFDVVFNRVFVSFRISVRDRIPIGGCACRGFLAPRCDPAQPALARAPWRPCPSPMRPPLSLLFLSLIQFSRTATSSPPPLSLPCGALGFGDGDRQIWTPR